MSNVYEHKGATISCTPFQQVSDPEAWDVQVRINAVLQVPTAFGPYQKKLFNSSDAAVDYGRKVAQAIIDRES